MVARDGYYTYYYRAAYYVYTAPKYYYNAIYGYRYDKTYKTAEAVYNYIPAYYRYTAPTYGQYNYGYGVYYFFQAAAYSSFSNGTSYVDGVCVWIFGGPKYMSVGDAYHGYVSSNSVGNLYYMFNTSSAGLIPVGLELVTVKYGYKITWRDCIPIRIVSQTSYYKISNAYYAYTAEQYYYKAPQYSYYKYDYLSSQYYEYIQPYYAYTAPIETNPSHYYYTNL